MYISKMIQPARIIGIGLATTGLIRAGVGIIIVFGALVFYMPSIIPIITPFQESILTMIKSLGIICSIFIFIYIIIFMLGSEKKSTKPSWISWWYSIKIGFIYAKKVDNHYYANMIVNIAKKHLNIKDVTTADVLHDLNWSTKFGQLFGYRKFKGWIDSSIPLCIGNKIFTFCGLMIYIHRNPNIELPLNMYYMDGVSWSTIMNYDLNSLNIIEWIFLIGIVSRLYVLYRLWLTIYDRRLSILNQDPILLTKLNTKQKFFFLGRNLVIDSLTIFIKNVKKKVQNF